MEEGWSFPQMLLKLLHIYSQNNLNFPACNFPGEAVVKNLTVNAGDAGSLPGIGRSPGGENSNPLRYSCLENSMDRAPWWVTVHGVAKSQTQLITHNWSHTHTYMVQRKNWDICLDKDFLDLVSKAWFLYKKKKMISWTSAKLLLYERQ